MKKEIIAIIAAAVLVPSCSLDENLYTYIDESTYITDASSARNVLFGLYRNLCSLDLAPAVKYALVIFLTSFGGFCCAAQTASVIRGTGLMFLPYMAEKLAAAVASSFLAFVFYPVFCTL